MIGPEQFRTIQLVLITTSNFVSAAVVIAVGGTALVVQ